MTRILLLALTRSSILSTSLYEFLPCIVLCNERFGEGIWRQWAKFSWRPQSLCCQPLSIHLRLPNLSFPLRFSRVVRPTYVELLQVQNIPLWGRFVHFAKYCICSDQLRVNIVCHIPVTRPGTTFDCFQGDIHFENSIFHHALGINLILKSTFK